MSRLARPQYTINIIQMIRHVAYQSHQAGYRSFRGRASAESTPRYGGTAAAARFNADRDRCFVQFYRRRDSNVNYHRSHDTLCLRLPTFPKT